MTGDSDLANPCEPEGRQQEQLECRILADHDSPWRQRAAEETVFHGHPAAKPGKGTTPRGELEGE